MSGGISSVLTGGVGRRILGLFFLAALLPVIFTAFLAFHEVGRSHEQDLQRELRELSKAYGISVLTGLEAASAKAAEIVRIIEDGGIDAIQDRRYLVEDFTSISVLSPKYPIASIHGSQALPISASAIDFEQLVAGKSQLLEARDSAGSKLILIRGINVGTENQAIFSFQLSPERLWTSPEHLPYLTDFCAFSGSGSTLHCTTKMDTSILAKFSEDRYTKDRRPVTTILGEEKHLAATWELFLKSRFSHPSIHVVASQPKIYALRSGADFRRVFPPALLLVILLVGTLSFNLIGQSLVPLQRLTILARQFASGDLAARVRVRTGDEFETLADAFNNMAGRLGQQIATLKAMSKIDRLILSGAEFEEISEDVIDHLIKLTGYESAAIIARDVDGRNEAKMISWCEDQFIHERIALPKELGHDWCQPREVEVKLVDPAVAPYRERFLSYGLRYVLIIPVVLNDELKGTLLLGSDRSFESHGGKVKRCIDLAGRLAVALASAEREEALYRQAHFDELTGLPNRQLLKDRLEQQLVHARRNDSTGAILYLDLDRFKEINDVFGHSVGDIVLTQTAARIVNEVRDTDTVARLGGDEFIVVMPNHASGNTLRMAASRILTRLTEPILVRGTNHFLSASIGIVVFPDDGGSVETLLQNGDAAMYRAKDAGRSRFEFFSKKLNAESRRKIELEHDLRSAFDDKRLEVYFQPQFNLKDGAVWGAEALMRWRHDEQLDYRFYEGLFQCLYQRCVSNKRSHGFRFKNKLFSLDASLIDVSMKVFPWVSFGRKKSAFKLHLGLDHDGLIPAFGCVTQGKVSDMTQARLFAFPKGSVVVFDKGFNCYRWHNSLTEKGIFFVSRIRGNAKYRVLERHAVNKCSGITSDQTIEYVAQRKDGGKLKPIRRVGYRDPETGKHYVFISNQFSWSAKTIADIYKQRWQVELFFKWIKQNLKIKAFLGTSENAVMTQIMAALCVYLLLAYLKFQSKINKSLQQIIRLLQLNLFTRRSLLALLQPPDQRGLPPPQLKLGLVRN